MKIAIITNSIYTFGGEQRVVCLIANELSKKYNVTIYTTDKTENNIYHISDNIEKIFFKPFESNILIKGFRFFLRFPILKNLKKLQFVQSICYYNKINAIKLINLLENKYDVVIGVSGELTMLLGLAQKYGLKSKTIGWEHNSFNNYFRIKNQSFYKMDKLWLYCTEKINKIVLLNELYTEQYSKTFNKSCTYIYNPRSFISTKKADLVNKTFITCCRFVEGKGIDLLLKSFKSFSEINQDWKLLLVGEGPEKNKYLKFIKKNNLSERIIFLGKRNDIKELLLDSSVYVLPSRWEGFPMSLTEAYEVGLPCIFYDIDAIVPFSKNNSGLICKSYDTKDFANAMQKFATSYELRKEYSTNAISFANQLSIENISKQWFELIESL